MLIIYILGKKNISIREYFLKVFSFLLRRLLLMNEVLEKEKTNVVNLIYEINGKQVMLDSEISRTK